MGVLRVTSSLSLSMPSKVALSCLCAALALVATVLSLRNTATENELVSIRSGKDWLRADVAESGAQRRHGQRRRADHHDVSYVGIIPYEKAKPRIPHPVACAGQSSVNCVVSSAARDVRGFMQDSKPTPGQLLVAHAAQGRGFSEWNVKPESKASLEKARQAVKAAAKGKAALDLLGGVWKGYEQVDRDIDNVHRAKHKTPTDHIQAAIKSLEEEKEQLRRRLRKQKEAATVGKAKKVVKQSQGWLDWFVPVKTGSAWGY